MGTVRAGLLPLGLAAIVYGCAGDGVAGPPSPEATAQRCAAAKIKAAGKKAHAKALCYAKAAAAGIPVSQACLDKAEAQFSAAFANAEEKASNSGGCVTTSDTNMSTLFSTSATSDCVTHPPLLLAFSSAFANAALNCASALSRQAWLTGTPAAAAFA